MGYQNSQSLRQEHRAEERDGRPEKWKNGKMEKHMKGRRMQRDERETGRREREKEKDRRDERKKRGEDPF